MPRKEHIIHVGKEVEPSIRIEVRVVVEGLPEFEGSSQLFAGELEGVPTDLSKEDVENGLFQLAVTTVNAAAWDIGLGVIFEVMEEDADDEDL